jgi:hypothetical protein
MYDAIGIRFDAYFLQCLQQILFCRIATVLGAKPRNPSYSSFHHFTFTVASSATPNPAHVGRLGHGGGSVKPRASAKLNVHFLRQ